MQLDETLHLLHAVYWMSVYGLISCLQVVKLEGLQCTAEFWSNFSTCGPHREFEVQECMLGFLPVKGDLARSFVPLEI